mmetsp:Transcript_65077/g.121268  ORF Transcript_65077/g.121268 Transcript_65077/m.121268 type:complete len:281 (+) Transcript_65077:114-956(+)
MGRKKVAAGSGNADSRPVCFYCDRYFDDEAVLIQHQRAKHFRCAECDDGVVRGKCETVQGLIIHTLKVHGKSLTKVPNAKYGRDSPELNVYGMDGLPEWFLRERGLPIPTAEPPPDPSSKPPPAPAAAAPPPLPSLPGFPAGLLPPPGPGMPPPPAAGLLPPPGPGMPPPPGAAGAGAANPPLPGLPLPGLPLPGGLPGALPTPVASTPGPMAALPAGGAAVLPAPGNGSAPLPVGLEARIPAANGCVQAVGKKRPVDDMNPEEDVSVEELRAELERYAT